MALVLDDLKTEVQARIDAISPETTLEELLMISKSADGLGLDLTNLEDALNTVYSALTPATDLEDVLQASKARPAADAEAATVLSTTFLSYTITSAAIPAGQQTIFTITPPAGERIVISHLTSRSTTNYAGVTITGSESGDVVQNLSIGSNINSNTSAVIGNFSGGTEVTLVLRILAREIKFKIGETVTVTKNNETNGNAMILRYYREG